MGRDGAGDVMPTPEQLARWEQRLDAELDDIAAIFWDAEPIEVPR